jgi:hypothetical protein
VKKILRKIKIFLAELRKKPEREKRFWASILILILSILIILFSFIMFKKSIVKIPRIENDISQIERESINETFLIFKQGFKNVGKDIFNSLLMILGEKISLFLTKIFSFVIQNTIKLFFVIKNLISQLY